MSVREFRDRLAVTEKSLAEVKREIEAFEKRYQDALTAGVVGQAAEAKKQLGKAKERLEELAITKTGCQSKISWFQKNAIEGKKLVQEIGALHEKRRPIVDKIIKAQEEVGGWLPQVEAIDAEIQTKARRFEDLTGETLNTPTSPDLYPARSFAGSGIAGVAEGARKIQPLAPWKFVSSEERAQRQKEEMEKKRLAYEERLRVAQHSVPVCQKCGGKRNVVNEAGVAGRGYWVLKCEDCGATHELMIPETKS